MRFVMFSPGLTASAIGRMACMITHALRQQGHRVQVVRTEAASLRDQPTHDFGDGVVFWHDTGGVSDAIRAADLAIYQIGNHYGFHEGALEWLRSAPGVVCLHDFFLGNLFHSWAERRRPEAEALLRTWYGEEAVRGYFNHHFTEATITAIHDSAPMTEWVASQALGVVTHSSWGIARVVRACGGPVRVVPLAYTPPPGWPPTGERTDSRFQVLTVGHVNSNKRAESVIRAIAHSETLRSTTTFRLLGAIIPEVRDRLERLARDCGVRLVISGEVSNDELSVALRDADVVCCLRWPNLEAASASTIEAMQCGKAVVVTDTGFYAELPRDGVVRIHPDREVAELRTQLERLHAAPTERAALGERAARWARATFSPDNYARQLSEIALDCLRAAPVIDMVQDAARQLKLWGGQHFLQLPEILQPLRALEGKRPPTSNK